MREDEARKDPVGPVVLGVDGSASALSAAEVAASEAAALGVRLRIVHAYVWPLLYASLANVPYHADDWDPGTSGQGVVEAVANRMRTAHPDLMVETAVRSGDGGSVLVDESTDASLIVMGGTGVGGLAGLLAGPVARYVGAHAHCPVIVSRQGQRPASADDPVVVGIDGSPSTLEALDFACEWAARHGAEVTAVYQVPADEFDEPMPEFGSRTPAEVRADGWLEGVSARYPEVRVHPVVVHGDDVAETLLTASRSARMVVVGSRHRGELASLVLGSVRHDLIRRAHCPVALVQGFTERQGRRCGTGAEARV